MSEYKTEKKAPLQLIDPLFIEEMSRVQEIGDAKHKDHHWIGGVSVAEVLGAIKRHVAAIERGEYIDSEHGYPHAACAACGLMYIAHYCRDPERYAEFFDQLYQGSPAAGSGMGGWPISDEEFAGLLNKTPGGGSGAIRGPERGGTGGRSIADVGSVPSSGGGPREGATPEDGD